MVGSLVDYFPSNSILAFSRGSCLCRNHWRRNLCHESVIRERSGRSKVFFFATHSVCVLNISYALFNPFKKSWCYGRIPNYLFNGWYCFSVYHWIDGPVQNGSLYVYVDSTMFYRFVVPDAKLPTSIYSTTSFRGYRLEIQ